MLLLQYLLELNCFSYSCNMYKIVFHLYLCGAIKYCKTSVTKKRKNTYYLLVCLSFLVIFCPPAALIVNRLLSLNPVSCDHMVLIMFITGNLRTDQSGLKHFSSLTDSSVSFHSLNNSSLYRNQFIHHLP